MPPLPGRNDRRRAPGDRGVHRPRGGHVARRGAARGEGEAVEAGEGVDGVRDAARDPHPAREAGEGRAARRVVVHRCVRLLSPVDVWRGRELVHLRAHGAEGGAAASPRCRLTPSPRCMRPPHARCTLPRSSRRAQWCAEPRCGGGGGSGVQSASKSAAGASSPFGPTARAMGPRGCGGWAQNVSSFPTPVWGAHFSQTSASGWREQEQESRTSDRSPGASGRCQ
eukprot:gene1748-biopygen313